MSLAHASQLKLGGRARRRTPVPTPAPNSSTAANTSVHKEASAESSPPLLPDFGAYKLLVVHCPPADIPISLLFKPHQPSSATSSADATTADESKSLFVCNLPVDATSAHIARLFRRCGPIANITMHNQPTTAAAVTHIVPSARRSCIVTFCDPEDGVLRAMQMRVRRRIWSAAVSDAAEGGDRNSTAESSTPASSFTENLPLYGLQKWINDFAQTHPPHAALEALANTHLKQYDEMHTAHQQELKRRRTEPDEDGFILVSGAGAAPAPPAAAAGAGTAGTAALRSAASASTSDIAANAAAKKKKKKALEKVDFYRFQMRESKRNQLAELRTKFEQDKVKIQQLKETRSFRPY
ncbi:Ribosomal RNA-processing protein 7 A [Entophlyctis luteolus]|nr:Ribosomal RNA-processing protein 7 A [Entophlyctis luteolus]